MQTCYNCGKEVSDDTLICPDCGALVRRYTAPPPAAEPAAPAAPAKPVPGKVRFYGFARVWLILLIVFASLMCLSSLYTVFYAVNADALSQMLKQPGMEALAPLLEELLPMMQELLPLFIVFLVCYTVKLLLHIWLLRSGRRLPFFISVGVSAVAIVVSLALGGNPLSFLDPVFTYLAIRRFWPWMEK